MYAMDIGCSGVGVAIGVSVGAGVGVSVGTGVGVPVDVDVAVGAGVGVSVGVAVGDGGEMSGTVRAPPQAVSKSAVGISRSENRRAIGIKYARSGVDMVCSFAWWPTRHLFGLLIGLVLCRKVA
jgi:hypothetical protein